MAGQRHLLYVLALFEAGLALLATVGQTISMGGNVLYVVSGVAEAALFAVAGLVVTRGHRWGLMVLMVCEGLRLAGWGVSTVLGMTPWLQVTLTGSTLADGLVLPVVVVLLCARLWPRLGRPAPLAPTLGYTGSDYAGSYDAGADLVEADSADTLEVAR